jgi:pyruvate dehydrogenase E2 component (dihydrolipoamide acetyltransferase)
MAETKVIMPQMGESIFEGTLTKWLKKKGDRIERDEPLFEISTDKIDSEIPAPASGIVQDILVKEGQTVQINTVVAVIGDGSAKPAEAPKAATVEALVDPHQPAGASRRLSSVEEGSTEGLRSSPLVRRIAREHGIDVSALAGRGTGLGGRISRRDILSYIEQGGKTPGSPPVSVPETPPMKFSGDVERVPLTPMRKAIADHMVMSRKTSAHVSTLFEVDCWRIMKAKEKQQAEFERSGTRLTVTPFFVQAAAKALKRFPIVNSSLDGDTIVYKRAINIGIAVNLEWGLIVPVIRAADEKNLLSLAKAVNDIGARARSKKLTPDDVKDGTFTITNPGQYGGLIGTPIINQPQVAILGMGGIKKRAVVIDDAIAIRPMIMLSLSFDHRVIDGAVADQFMADIQKQLENWPV